MFYKKSEGGALELQVWVWEGRVLEEPGLNAATYTSMMWRDARALTYSTERHKILWTRWLVAKHEIDI